MHCVNRFAIIIIIILLSIYYHGKGNTKVQGLYKLSPYTNTHTDYITKYKNNYSYIIDSIIDGMVLLSMIVYTISVYQIEFLINQFNIGLVHIYRIGTSLQPTTIV